MVVLPPEPTSSAQARAFVAGRLQGTPAAFLLDRALLVTAELVANAVLHARTPIQVDVVLDDDVLRVEVADAVAALPIMPARAPDAVDGRGLRLVEALADGGWGVISTDDGKTVWAALIVEPEGARA